MLFRSPLTCLVAIGTILLTAVSELNHHKHSITLITIGSGINNSTAVAWYVVWHTQQFQKCKPLSGFKSLQQRFPIGLMCVCVNITEQTSDLLQTGGNTAAG